MTVAMLLLTCGRVALTRATVESFSAQNPDARDRFLLLHADDASPEPEIATLAQAHGFETVVTHATRRGFRTGIAEATAIAAARGADWVVTMDNDMQWVRPFPWRLFDWLTVTQPTIYALRLFGEWKDRAHRERCLNVHLGLGRRAVTWRRLVDAPEPTEVARIHWGGPLLATRIAELRALQAEPVQAGYDPRGDVRPEIQQSGRIAADIARVVENVAYHIGKGQRTARPGVVATTRAPAPFRTWSRPAPVPRAVVPASARVRPARYTPAWQATRAKYQAGSSRCLDLALARGPRPASLLDVGCGDGSLVARARALGIDAIGMDLSVEVETPELRHADLREPVDLGRLFDWVTCWEVAEHLPEAAADTLVATLARHLAPGGRLLFTAAHPHQGGDGHLNEQPAAYWRDKLAAAGLRFEPVETHALAAQWTAEARTTPWYGANLQVCTAPGTFVRVTPPPPRIAITMRTADRAPHPNYVGGTIARLIAQGLDPSAIHLCPTAPEIGWLEQELHGTPVTLHTPATRRTPNENGLAQIRVLDPRLYDWVLLLEDDLAFCADFLGSVQRWITKAARPDRQVYRLFTFRNRPPTSRTVYAYDWPLKNMCGTQAVLLRMAEARDFLEWGDRNLETWGGFRGNPRIAFDKLMAAWALATWPDRPGVLSHPMFVQHIGDISSLHPAAMRMDAQFAGTRWSFAPQEASV